MITIYKYKITFTDLTIVELPKDAKILTVQEQNNEPYLWALVDTEKEKETRHFRIAGTGHEIEKEITNQLDYINTFQLRGGSLVFHLFEILSVHKAMVKGLGNTF